jgi:hypothetical protein
MIASLLQKSTDIAQDIGIRNWSRPTAVPNYVNVQS